MQRSQRTSCPTAPPPAQGHCRTRRSRRARSGVDLTTTKGPLLGGPFVALTSVRSPMDINGAAAIVTGGASGLGEATAKLLAEKGARVVIADVQDDKGEVVAKSVDGIFAHTDVTSEEDVIATVEAGKELGPLRVLV